MKTQRTAATREDTRTRLITTAERLFAEVGVSVSMREVAKAAGQANKSAVAYHFGTRDDLVLAIARHHDPDIEQRRVAMVAALPQSRGSFDAWLACLVKPITDHLAGLGKPTCYARFLACCMADPRLRNLIFTDAVTSPSMRSLIDQVNARLLTLPADVLEARGSMCQHVIVHTCADYERALEGELHSPHESWQGVCDAIVDVLVGLWSAPVTPRR